MRWFLALALVAGTLDCWRGAVREPEHQEVAVEHAPPPRSLFARLGGIGGIRAVVDELMATLVSDQRINVFFANADIPGLKRVLVEQLCSIAGGACIYTGKDMRIAHLGMGIRAEHFDALIEDLQSALDARKIEPAAARELVDKLELLRGDVIAP